MRKLEETNCEIRNIINFELPQWKELDNLTSLDEHMITDGLKESNGLQTLGGFLNNDCRHVWLSHDTRLLVIDARHGKCISSWNFTDKITSVSSFPAESGQVPLLLIGLDNNALRIRDSVGHLCIFDCCTSTILATIQVPAGVEKACIIHGGTEWEQYNEKRRDTVLSGNTGLIFAALRNLQHVIIDVNRSLWQNLYLERKSVTAKLEFVNSVSTHLISSSKGKKEPTHLAYNLMDREIEQYMGFDREEFESTPLYDENLCSVLLSSTKIGCLVTGCLGRVIIWQNDGSIGWISPAFDENAYVTHVALLEPSDDPRPFYYLWIVCQSDSSQSSAVLRMYAMLFNKKCSDKNGESSLYFNLESEPSLKFELELEEGERVHTLVAVERENCRDITDGGCRRGEDSLLLIGSNDRLLLFDLNRWYKEQMPRTMAKCRNPNSVMASYCTKTDEPKRSIMACNYISRSLREFPTKGPTSPEELFYPNSLSLQWVELTIDGLTYWLTRGAQVELLREITIAGPIVLVKPTETYRRCLSVGLVPFDTDSQDYTFDAEKLQQREMLLSLCLEQRWTNLLIRCATEWSDGSASFLYPEFLRWGVQRASELKLIADRLCVPLFDQSDSNIGETEVKTLRFCCQQLECLTVVVSKLPNLEEDLQKERRALKRIATYLQVILWFHDVRLLPESQEMDDDDDISQISLSMKIPYPRDKLIELYEKKRRNSKKDTEEEEILFIDQLLLQDCSQIKAQWEREAGSDLPDLEGYYPPPSLQSLLRSFLTDCYQESQNNMVNDDDSNNELVETIIKHCITIYLLMDLAMLLQGSHPAIDRLIQYPSAFKLSPSLIKLTQAFWLLDHEDYEGFFKIMTGQLISTSDIKDWHHKLAINTLLKNDQHKLALMYLRMLKPPLSTLEDQGMIISLSVEQGLIESAFHSRPPSHYSQLLTRFFQACKTNGKLKQILHLSLDSEEEEAFLKFLKENECEDTRLLFYLQRCRQTEANDFFSMNTTLNLHHSTASNKIHPITLKMLEAFNATLPDITKRFANTIRKNLANCPASSRDYLQQVASETRGYPRPMSHCRDQTREIYEIAMSKTRETCFKADRSNSGGSSNHIPFLAAPCSTIVYCTRVTGSSSNEPTEGNCITYPERKVEKKSCNMMNDEEDNESGIQRKRRRLDSEYEVDFSRGDNDTYKARRLSMSQVCDTPMVQRKVQSSQDRESNNLVGETPRSILKIRRMFRRNSNSSGFGFDNDSLIEREAFMKRSDAGDMRSARQIRFSMDRLSANDETMCSTNDSSRVDNEQESNHSENSKNTEEESCLEESYYSPNTSAKSLRDSSILTDSSFTKYIHGPRPRPSLRSSFTSQSDYHSHETSSVDNTTVSASILDTSFEKNRKISCSLLNTPNKFIQSPSLHCESILSPNTSIESSPLKRSIAVNNIERQYNNNSEESDDQTEDEEESEMELDKNKNPTNESAIFKNFDEEKEVNQEIKSDEIMMQVHEEEEEGETEHEKLTSAKCHVLQEDEISEDEDEEEQEQQSEQAQESKEYLEEEKSEDSFQSLSNSMNTSYFLESTSNLEEKQEIKYSIGKESYTSQHVSLRAYNYEEDISLTKNIVTETKKREAADFEEYEYQRSSYSLTKPIFIDSHGIVKCDESVDITDDESMDAGLEKSRISSVSLPEVIEEKSNDEDEEEAELTLNLSEESEENMEKKEKFVTEKPEKEEVSRLDTNEMLDLINTSVTSEVTSKKQTLLSKKETSVDSRSRLSSSSSTKSDSMDEENLLKRNTKQVPTSLKQLTPRRSIKSVSVSHAEKSSKSNKSEYEKDDQNKQITSVSKEVSKILSMAIAEPAVNVGEKNELEKEKSSPISKTSKSKAVRKTGSSSRQLSREPSQDKQLEPEKQDLPLIPEETIISKRSTRTSKKNKGESVESTIPVGKASKTRASSKAGSIAKDTLSNKEVEKPTRRTRATSITEENTVLGSSVRSKEIEDEPTEKKTGRSRMTRASSIAKETEMMAALKKDQQKAASKMEKSEVNQDVESTTRLRTTRASSLAKDSTTRKTRASSIAKDEEETHEKSLMTARKTRASSIAKEEESLTPNTRRRRSSMAKELSEEDTKPTIKRTTRGSSLAKELTEEKEETHGKRSTRALSISKETTVEHETVSKKSRASSVTKEIDNKEEEEEAKETSKRTTRKRGGSMPKEMSVLETSRLHSRGRRSTSLLKEVILEESFSQLDSPTNGRRNRIPHIPENITSSPAANTRSRRSSIQSMPEELEDVFSAKSTTRRASMEIKDEPRSRRAMSVDSTEVVPTGKRRTRSVLAKTNIIDVIPEEDTTKSSSTKKQSTARKRATSVPVDAIEESEEDQQKHVKPAAKTKRGRKISESKDFLFSTPEVAGEAPMNDDECQTLIYKFSKPTGLQKFISPLLDDKESFDMTTNVFTFNKVDSEQAPARNLRRPRTYFVLPKRRKDKAK